MVATRLIENNGGSRFGAWTTQAGAELVEQVGLSKDSNLSDLGKGDAVLIIATDLEEEAPIYRLRLKQARERGAKVFVANARSTRMDDFVRRAERIRYDAGQAAHFMANLSNEAPEVAETLTEAENLVIVAGAEGLTLDGSQALMQAAANFLIDTDHVGKQNNGLIGVFPGPNGMGLQYMGYTAQAAQDIIANPPKVLVIAQADVNYDDPTAAKWLDEVETVIHLTLFEDEPVGGAKAALPVQSFAEREGTYVNVERRVQRFYTGQGPLGAALPAWQIASRLNEKMGFGREQFSAAAVMLDITKNVPGFENCRYKSLAQVETQYPLVGREDVYYGGTAYDNKGGLGVQLETAADRGEDVSTGEVSLPDAPTADDGELVIIPTRRLYNRERVMRPSLKAMLEVRTAPAFVAINEADADTFGIADGDTVTVNFEGGSVQVTAHVNGAAPAGSALLPRHLAETATPMGITVGTISK